MVRVRSNDDVRECPICMDPVKFAAETNCGHLYCGDCILRVWDGNIDTTATMPCPYCRTGVTLLLACFTKEESNDTSPRETLEEREMINVRLHDYNRLHGAANNTYLNHIKELPTILRHVWAHLFTWEGLSFLYRLRIVSCFIFGLLYLFVPFDLFPEALLGIIGLIDDFMIVGFVLIQVSVMFRAHLANT